MNLDELDARACGARRFLAKTCIVTGAGQGIGRATAKRLAAEGAHVIAVDRIRDTAEETADILIRHGASAQAIVADIADPHEARRLMKTTVNSCGTIDVLINVVGGTIWWQPFRNYTEEQIAIELERSLFTTLWCCHAVLPYMIAQCGGAIVNVSSGITRGGLYRTPYAISKGGVDALTKCLALENMDLGIRVNAVAPGSTSATDRVTSRLLLKDGEVAEPADPENSFWKKTRETKRIEKLRQSLPEEQAAAIAFLASDDASYVTGQILHCCGTP